MLESTNTTANAADMPIKLSGEEITKLTNTYRFYLFRKGFRNTFLGEFTNATAAEAKEKCNLSESISDFDFGSLEGRIFFSMMLSTFRDHNFEEGHLAWIKGLISMYTDKIWCFIFKCVANKPQISASTTYDFAEQLDSKLHDPIYVKEKCRDEIRNWYCTPYEFGQLCGFISDAHWAIGEEWKFNEDDFDVPIDWKRFHEYLERRSLKLKQRKIREMSVIFQMFLEIPHGGRGGGKNDTIIRMQSRRGKLPSEPVDNGPAPFQLSSWLDW